MEEEAAAASGPGLAEQIWLYLIEAFGPAGPFYAIAGIGVVLVLVALPIVLRKPKDPLSRFNFDDEKLRSELVRLREDSDDGALSGLAEYLEPKDQEEMSEVRAMLRAAGYRGGSAVRQYYFARAGLGFGLLLIGLIMTFLVPENPDLVFSGILSGLLALAGYFAPSYIVRRKIEVRKEQITNGFPDSLDMMLVCVEAGQSLDQSIVRVARELRASYPDLADEFEIVAYEMKAGKEKDKVLRDMGTRCGVIDVSSFVTVMIQSSQFGTSIAEALRVYAGEMRDKRVMRAEEAANKLPTKMTLATMMLTVPPLLIILVGPSAKGIMDLGNMSK